MWESLFSLWWVNKSDISCIHAQHHTIIKKNNLVVYLFFYSHFFNCFFHSFFILLSFFFLHSWKLFCLKHKMSCIKHLVTVFSEKTDVPPPNFQLFYCCDFENKVKSVLVMLQLYTHENLVRIQPLVHKILCRQEIVMPMPTLMVCIPETICTPPYRLPGHKK